jgi:hypothetical protein
VREDDVPSHIKEESLRGDVGAGEAPRFLCLVDQEPVFLAVLVETRRCSESRRAGTDDENADLFLRGEEEMACLCSRGSMCERKWRELQRFE